MKAPEFEEVGVEADLKDGYWIQATDINGDGRPDIVTSGLAEGVVAWYENPSWKKRTIGEFVRPVGLDAGDIAGDGRMDIVLCHDYGETMFDCKPGDGKISWLRNPGEFGSDGQWEQRSVGDLLAAHRVRVGRFSGNPGVEVMGLPVVGPMGGREALHAPVRVTLYRRPEDALSTGSWEEEVVDDSSFRIIHGAAIDLSEGGDSLLLASEEGISWLGRRERAWRRERLAEGEPPHENTDYKGSANVAIGRVGEDPSAYIAAVEPFHGNTLAVYTKESDGGLTEARWRRTVLDVFGEPNEVGEGPAHHVVAADFDGDGDDEFLVALRGPMPWQGVFYYKTEDLSAARFSKTRVSTPSAARIAVADFDGDGRLDVATTGYYTPGYFLCDDPRVVVFLNRFGQPLPGQAAIPAGPLGG